MINNAKKYNVLSKSTAIKPINLERMISFAVIKTNINGDTHIKKSIQ